MYWQFIILLITHFVADFVLQTHWQASNKSKNYEALGNHILTYMAVLYMVSLMLFDIQTAIQIALVFTAINGILHFITDWCTSRITSKLFLSQFATGKLDSGETVMYMKPGFNLHNFFVVVGFDQLIHELCLGITLWLLYRYFLST